MTLMLPVTKVHMQIHRSDKTKRERGEGKMPTLGQHFEEGGKWKGIAFGTVHRYSLKWNASRNAVEKEDDGKATKHFAGPFQLQQQDEVKDMWFFAMRKEEFGSVFKQKVIYPKGEGAEVKFAAALMAVSQLSVKDFHDAVERRWPDREGTSALKFPWMHVEKSKPKKTMADAHAGLRRLSRPISISSPAR